jgi:hypothetical protein
MSVKQLLRFACLLAFVVSTTTLLCAQDEAKPAKSGKSKTVTGCVQKGTEAGGYTLTDESGKVWELASSAAKVSAHVGHKVTLTGSPTKAPKATEAKKESNEKEEAGSGTHAGDFKVSSVKMISETCSQ